MNSDSELNSKHIQFNEHMKCTIMGNDKAYLTWQEKFNYFGKCSYVLYGRRKYSFFNLLNLFIHLVRRNKCQITSIYVSYSF